MRSLVFLCLLALAAARPSDRRRNLHGAQVLRTVPHLPHQIHYLRRIFVESQYDFWAEPRSLGHPVDIMGEPWQLPILKAGLEGMDLKYTVMIGNVAQLVKETTPRETGPRAMDWTSYHDYDEITAWMEQLAADNPSFVSIEDVGTTFEGRPMKLLTVGSGGTSNPGIFIDGGIHAREWISPATVTYMVDQLVNDPANEAIINGVTFYVMPSINPDGYQYTFSDDRFWRKTRSRQDGVACVGADPNRNWDYHWGEEGTSDLPCSDIYCGPVPFSEVEMQVVRDQLLRLGSSLDAYLTFHSYSQLWMYPWGWTSALPEDWQDLDALAQDAVAALTAVHGTNYEIGSSTNTIYAAAGGSDDWAKGVGNIKYSYTVELRDTGNYGFLLPPSQIIPSGEETFEALKVYANYFMNGGTR